LVLKFSLSKKRNALLALLSLVFFVSACGTNTTPVVVSTATLSQPTQLPPTPTLTPEPPKVLNICLAEDPDSLFRYEGRDSLSKQSVFSALYDVDVLFETQPTYANGQARKTAVDVKPGMNVLDGNGKLAVLKEGSLIHPVLDGQLAEPAAWTASAPMQMMQVTLEYTLAPGLVWSDGSPMTAADFLLSYEVANDLRNPQDSWLLDRTASMEALDDRTITWTGIPGFVPVDLSELVFQPLPAAQFSGLSPLEVASILAADETPIGWGAYRITARTPGSEIQLERNPNYNPRPNFDQVVFIVEADLQQASGKLQSGACDVLDPSYHLEGQGRDVLTILGQSGSLVAENFEFVQQLVFGIQPAAYDSSYSPWTATRQDFFGDLRTRQAIAACLAAKPIASEILGARLPEGFSLPEFPAWVTVEQAQALLDEIGWLKDEAQPEAARIATSVENVLDGTVFSVSLLSGTSTMDSEVSQAVVGRLGQCGIKVTHQALSPSELYAPGPEGPLFGRSFDLALVSWQETPGNACELYRSDAIPNGSNYWIGTNLAGMAEAGFDTQCIAFENAELAQNLQEGLELIEELLPSLPLMPQISVWFASDRVDLAGGSAFADIGLWRPVLP
jgi:peptide/nickel transport system substrate-binding protein